MKRLIFTLILLLFSSISVAQEKLDSYALQIGYWNFYTERYDWQETKVCDVSFFVQGDVIIANDYAESTYYTYECTLKSKTICSWLAYDERRRKCWVSMVFGETSFFIVTYKDMCYRYYVNI